jgi:hypothetical protein
MSVTENGVENFPDDAPNTADVDVGLNDMPVWANSAPVFSR